MKNDKRYFFPGGMLKELRRKKAIDEKRKISQHIFADEIRKPYGTVATWETRGIPKIEDAVLVAEYYDVPIPELPAPNPYLISGTGGAPVTEADGAYFTPGAQAVIEALNRLIETKDQIIAEKDRVIELLQRQLAGANS